MGSMAALFPPEVFKQHYLNLFLSSLDDPVAEVRYSACKSFGPICLALEQDAKVFDGFKSRINSFSTSKRSFHRQSFALMIQSLIADTVPQ